MQYLLSGFLYIFVLSFYSGDSEEYYDQPFVAKPIATDTSPSLVAPRSTTTPSVPYNSNTYTSDPFTYEGRLVKMTRLLIEDVEVSQNSEIAGTIDIYEEGRLMAFSVTCNDRDMIPVCKIQSASGSEDTINDLSYLEAVIHGRGMTYSEAISTVKIGGIDQSRDVSGQQLSAFPYVARFKDTVTGSFSNYADYKGTINDKCYVMKFEPTIYPPYSRFYFTVANNSTEGTRMLNRLEIKRLVYVEEDPRPSASDLSTEFTQFNTELLKLKNQLNGGPPPPTTAGITTSAYAKTDNSNEDLFNEFLQFMNNKKVTKARFNTKPNYYIDDARTQAFRSELARRIQGEEKKERKKNNNGDTMSIHFG